MHIFRYTCGVYKARITSVAKILSTMTTKINDANPHLLPTFINSRTNIEVIT